MEQEIADQYQDFFNFMNKEHGIILTCEEMDEIRHEVKLLDDKLQKLFANKD